MISTPILIIGSFLVLFLGLSALGADLPRSGYDGCPWCDAAFAWAAGRQDGTPVEEQNFSMVMEMLRAGDVDEENNTLSPLDNLFYDLRKTDPGHIALKYYDARSIKFKPVLAIIAP